MNSQDEKDLWTRIAQNLESESNIEDFSHSFDESNAHQDACMIWKLCGQMPKIKADVDTALVGIQQKIAKMPAKPVMQIAPSKIWWKSGYAIAASVALLVMTTISVYIINKETNTPVVYQTTKGEKRKVTLPDGSVVMLNADTQLELASDFGQSARRLTLNGEAYFEVTSNPNQPFIISTLHSMTEVVGTAFNLKAYSNDADVALNVTEGKVKFGSTLSAETILVSASQGAILNIPAQTITPIQTIENLTWRDGVISFKDESLANAAAYLSRWYDISISVDESIKTKKITGQFQNKSIVEVLDYIKLALDIDYISIEAKQYKLLPKKK